MPELPDITVYLRALQPRVLGRQLDAVRIRNPFVVRTYDPPMSTVEGRTVMELRRLGKRIVFGFGDDLWLIVHLMIAGRLHWKARGAKFRGKIGLAAFDFQDGTLLFTEAGSKRRASLHLVQGNESLRAHDPGGLDVFAATPDEFATALRRDNHTIKRSLTDPHIIDGVGNSYSDEILHRARMSPFLLTRNMSEDDMVRLWAAAREVLTEWIERLSRQAGDAFPEKVTAFRPEMAVHGRFGQPCPICSAPVQRIRYADNETNYCPGCQTDGRILADRSLSRLLKNDWPAHLDDL